MMLPPIHYLTTPTPLAAAPAASDTGVNSPNWVLPFDASSTGDQTSWLFWLINWISVFFTVIVLVALVWFVFRYRQRGGVPEEGRGTSHSTTLEITWTLIPTMIVLVIFVYGFRVYLDKTIPPDDANEIDVMGVMWNWSFMYPDGNGGRSPNLVVPVNEPVTLTLQSSDVIHSVFIPAFRVKKDAVPGRYNKMWFEADRLGTYELFCTEYCGTLHSKMGAKVQVVTREEYDKHLELVSDPFNGVDADGNPIRLTYPEVGEKLWNQLCITCHSVDGSAGTGPTWQGLYGKTREFTDGTQAVADEAYLRESILYPGRKIVVGYGNAMPSFAGQLNDEEVRAINSYIATLSDGYKVGEDGQILGPGDSTGLDGPSVEEGPSQSTGGEPAE